MFNIYAHCDCSSKGAVLYFSVHNISSCFCAKISRYLSLIIFNFSVGKRNEQLDEDFQFDPFFFCSASFIKSPFARPEVISRTRQTRSSNNNFVYWVGLYCNLGILFYPRTLITSPLGTTLLLLIL